MGLDNVPDDWSMYYCRCSDCGRRYHLSEGGCDCYLERREELRQETIARLEHPSMRIAWVEEDSTRYGLDDDLGCSITPGDAAVRVHILEADGSSDELVFSAESWVEVLQLLQLGGN